MFLLYEHEMMHTNQGSNSFLCIAEADMHPDDFVDQKYYEARKAASKGNNYVTEGLDLNLN